MGQAIFSLSVHLKCLRSIVVIVTMTMSALGGAQEKPRNIWEEQYHDRSAVEMAAQFESPSRPVYRHRLEIVGLLDLKPGMSVAEIGAGSGFLSRIMAEKVAPSGRAVATELDEKMVRYMNERARVEGLRNFTAIRSQPMSTGIDRASMDVVVIVNTYSFFDRPDEMLRSVKETLKPEGLLLIVDFPRTSQRANAEGVNAEDVIASAAKAGLKKIAESSVVPGHYAIKFRKR